MQIHFLSFSHPYMPWAQKITQASDTLTILQPSGRRKESSGNFRKNAPNTATYIPRVKQGEMWSTHSKVLSNWKSGPAVWYACPPKAHVLKAWSPAGGAVDVCALFISRPRGSGVCWEELYQVGHAFVGYVFPRLFPSVFPRPCEGSSAWSHPSTMMLCLTTDCKNWGQVTKGRNPWDWAKRVPLNCVCVTGEVLMDQ